MIDVQVSATDRDKAGANSLVAYSLKQPSEFFSVDPASGEIFSKQMVRYKHSTKGPSPENVYTLTVVATDNGKPPLSSECLLNVHVVDGHNNAPRFRQANYFSPVPDSVILAHKIIQLQVEPTSTTQKWVIHLLPAPPVSHTDFQCTFRALSEHFRSTFRALSEQFQSSFLMENVAIEMQIEP